MLVSVLKSWVDVAPDYEDFAVVVHSLESNSVIAVSQDVSVEIDEYGVLLINIRI